MDRWMLDTTTAAPSRPDEALVRHYLTALNNGQFLEALNAFSMDASFRDETGRERHGIREIAAAFVHRERPVRVEIEELRHEGDAVAVLFRMTAPDSLRPRVFRSVFRIRKDRIRSLEMAPWPTPLGAGPGLARST